MEATDLARQVAAFNQPADRPSPLVLVVFSQRWRGLDIRNRNLTMRITAPIEDGRLVLRIVFPTPNYTPTIGRNNAETNVQTEGATLEYDGSNNLEGAAACIEGHMALRDVHDIMLFDFLDDGELGANPLSRWSLCFEGERGNQTSSRLHILQQILRSLSVR